VTSALSQATRIVEVIAKPRRVVAVGRDVELAIQARVLVLPPTLGYAPALLAHESASAGTDDQPALAALMERYAAGDATAFDALYAALSPRLFGYLLRLIGDRAAAEDALQQTFIRLHEARGAYVRGADPAPWLFTIAHRVALDELRRRKRARVRLAHEGERLPDPRAEMDGSREGAAPEAPDERIQVTLELLQKLPEQQRAALVLTKLEGRSLAEAAAISGTTSTAIKLRAHRAYVRLRELLGKTSS
jgi:RNA polymerase sigma-70 factor, ECF subfamily